MFMFCKECREKMSAATRAGLRRAKRAGTALGRKKMRVPNDVLVAVSNGETYASAARRSGYSEQTIKRRHVEYVLQKKKNESRAVLDFILNRES